MKKIVIVYGLIAGLIVSAIMVVTMATVNANGHNENGMLIGYASMLLAFSMVFVGIKNYRDKYNNGVISFGRAFRIGLYITLIASTMYVAVWLIDYFFFIPDFLDKYAAQTINKLKASGTSQLEIDKQTKEMASFAKMYQNPFFNALMTYAEILPVGLLVSLVSAFILKRKQGPAAVVA